eukprot:s1833_g11.t1
MELQQNGECTMAMDDFRILLTRSSFWIYIVLALHFALCVLILSKAPGDRPYSIVSGITLSQPVQWGYSAFCLVSVFFIVQAYVGAVYMLESHLKLGIDSGRRHACVKHLGQTRNMYYYFLAVSILVDIAFLFLFIWAWLSAVPLVLFLTLTIVFKFTSLYITSKYSKLVRSQYNAELLPHLKSALGRSFNVAPQFTPAPAPRGMASMQERPSPQFDAAQKAYQTMPEFQRSMRSSSPSRLVRVVHLDHSDHSAPCVLQFRSFLRRKHLKVMAKDELVPYVNTWFWPSFTLVGTSSLFFGVYIGKDLLFAQSSRQGGPLCDESASHRSQVRGHGNIRGSTGGALALISAFGRDKKIWRTTGWHLKLLLMPYADDQVL